MHFEKDTHEQIIDSPKFNHEEEIEDKDKEEHIGPNPPRDSNTKTSLTLVTFSNFQIKETSSLRESSMLSSKLLISGELFWNKSIIIDHFGMQNGLRKKQDGQAYFGLSNSKDYTGTYLNDLVLNFTCGKATSANSTGRVFDISFQKKTNDYQLYMIHSSLMLNYYIENYFYFEYEREYFMMLGKVFMTFSTRKKDKMYEIYHIYYVINTF